MNQIMNINQLDFNKVYTYADYLLWRFSERVELLKGRIFQMSPAPSRKHQSVSFAITGEFYNAFKGKACSVFVAPFDVRLPQKGYQDEQIYSVVQPDLCVICDENKLDDRGCLGAPDLIIEILSPGNSKKEMKYKFELYEEAGVREYWVVNPLDEFVLMYILENGKYKAFPPIVDEEINSHIFPELSIHTDKIFN